MTSLRLRGRPVEEVAAALVTHVVTAASSGPRAGRSGTSARKALRKILERAPLHWLKASDRQALLLLSIQGLDEELRIRKLLGQRCTLSWVAGREGLDEAQLVAALCDPAIRRHYAWPEYSPVDGQIYFSAARFDPLGQLRLAVPEVEPAGRLLAPGWRR